MRRSPTIETLPLAATPLEVLAAWPADRPLVVLHSGAGDRRWSRWSIFATPRRWLEPDAATDPLDALDAATAETRLAAPPDGPTLPFVGGWIGYLSYELGAVIEPAARNVRRREASTRWPLLGLAWCPDALVHDGSTGVWYAVGDAAPPPIAPPGREPDREPRVGDWSSSLSPDDYLDAVERTLAYIGAGDVFQANVSQRLTAPFSGDPRRLALRALTASNAWYGAHLELPGGRTLVSMSPELFLETSADDRAVVTRPIKGTRPHHVAASELRASAKDAAELHMIVDLMRNDLGRVCTYGSVRVPAARSIETHGTVHHGVGAVTGTLRPDVSVTDLLRATFPGGSVTGAPKIRAMQIIDELEPVERGPYCGAIGFVSDHGDVRLNIAIRTLRATRHASPARGDGWEGTLEYAVGCGIVADSDPMDEYRESLDKAAVLAGVFGDAAPGRPRAIVGEGSG
jgi:para-aminobenzoate synthetase component 1